MNQNEPVALNRCDTYNPEQIKNVLAVQFQGLGITEKLVRGKKVVLKPNLLLGYAPEKAATTHPAVVEGVIALLRDMQAESILIAESPGGPYYQSVLNGIYQVCGMTQVSEKTGVPLNNDLSATEVKNPDGTACKTFHLLTPLCQADLIVNLCKLKTHALAGMTAAAKNLFGAIPGIEKFEMHARYPDPSLFFRMLTELNLTIDRLCPVIHICDAIVGMEGNGPSGGAPRPIGCLITSRNPFCLDLAAAGIILPGKEIPLLRAAQEQALCPDSVHKLSVIGDPISAFALPDFKPADTAIKSKFDKIPNFMRPRPEVNFQKCAGCGTCVRSCPAHAMQLINRKATIRRSQCIRCFCCQELCTFKAIRIHRSLLLRAVQHTRSSN